MNAAPARRGFTLVELIVVVALAGVVVALAAPSFYDYMLRQRLKNAVAQLQTDLQLARSHATSTGTIGRVLFKSTASLDCYTIYTVRPTAADPSTVRCDCLQTPGSACPADAIELRTVQLPSTQGIGLSVASPAEPALGFDPVNGKLLSLPSGAAPVQLPEFVIDTAIDADRTLRTRVGSSGRPTLCSTGQAMGAPPC